jgi:putative isomerase
LLEDPRKFGGTWLLPSVARDDPAFPDNVYWRGRIWPNVNYVVWLGLKRYGFLGEAASLAERSYDLFMRSWRKDRIAAENYNAETGEALDQGDTDPFYIWAALLPMMAVEEICGFDPWNGWSLSNEGGDTAVGPVLSPIGRIGVRREGGTLRLERDAMEVLSTDVAGRLSQIALSQGHFSCRMSGTAQPGQFRLACVSPERVIAAHLDGALLLPHPAGGGGSVFDVPAAADARRFEVWFRPDGSVAGA